MVNGVCGDTIYIFELSSRIDKITASGLHVCDLEACAKRNRVWLVSASYQSRSIPFMFLQRLKQPRGLCLPFCLV